MTIETTNPIKYIRKHLNMQARRTGKPLLGKDWEKHAAITDPEHHYSHMRVHEHAAERERAAGNHERAEKHEHWAKGHHALARNKMSHMEWRADMHHASVDSELVSKVMEHPLVKEHPHSVFHQHDGQRHHVEFGGGEYEKSGHASHEDFDTAIRNASADYHLRNKKWSSAASLEETAGHGDTKWWNSLSAEQRHHYLKLHPDSKFAHHGTGAVPGKDHSARLADEAKLAKAHVAHLHNNLHSNRNISNMPELEKHMHKLGNVLHKMGERHEEGKPASKAHLDFLAKHVTPKYKAGKPHPHVASMVHSAKKQLENAHSETREGKVGDLAGMYAGDAADHFQIGHHIKKGEHKEAERKIDSLDTASREEIPHRLWKRYGLD